MRIIQHIKQFTDYKYLLHIPLRSPKHSERAVAFEVFIFLIVNLVPKWVPPSPLDFTFWIVQPCTQSAPILHPFPQNFDILG